MSFLFPSVRTVIDVGAEEGRAIRVNDKGKVVDFAINEKCAAGAGTFTETMARALEVELEEMGPLSLKSQKAVPMNAQCAAGTGSFLDQQAERLGVRIDEFAKLALRAQAPASIAGRCTVFAKTDMIHLQQRGVPLPEILSGLCYALARNFKSVIGRGKRFATPILFQGGVANDAWVRGVG